MSLRSTGSERGPTSVADPSHQGDEHLAAEETLAARRTRREGSQRAM